VCEVWTALDCFLGLIYILEWQVWFIESYFPEDFTLSSKDLPYTCCAEDFRLKYLRLKLPLRPFTESWVLGLSTVKLWPLLWGLLIADVIGFIIIMGYCRILTSWGFTSCGW
jgi:hypothetical protein